MGSRITKAVYRNQRSKPVQNTQIASAARFLSLFLYMLATIFRGYVSNIDLILQIHRGPHSSLSQSFTLSLLENTAVIASTIFLTLLCSRQSHRTIFLKCIGGSLISQILLYWAVSADSLALTAGGEVLEEITGMGFAICALSYIYTHFSTRKISLIFALYLVCHDLGVKMAQLLVPQVLQNTLPGVYGICILFTVLQLCCGALVFILERIYLLPKTRLNDKHQLSLGQLCSEAKKYSLSYVPLLLWVCVCQLIIGGLQDHGGSQQSHHLAWLFTSYVLIVSSFNLFQSSNRNLFILLAGSTFPIIVAHLSFGQGFSSAAFFICYSGLNLYTIHRLNTPKQSESTPSTSKFTLLLGLFLVSTHLGRWGLFIPQSLLWLFGIPPVTILLLQRLEQAHLEPRRSDI